MSGIAKRTKRVGSKINRRIQGQLDQASRSRAKKRSIRSLRENNVRADLMMLPSSGEQILFRVSDKINLSRIRSESRSIVIQVFEELDFLFWEFNTSSKSANVIHTLADNVQELFSLLQGRAELSHWYFQPLGKDGKPERAPRLLRELKFNRRYLAVRLYERVAFSSSSNFRSGSSQGVEIHFWNKETNYPEVESKDNTVGAIGVPIIVAPVWNETATSLPDPTSRVGEFERSLEHSQNPFATDVDFAIDAVYTWVDGADTVWQAQKASALHVLDEAQFVDDAVAESRFADHDELRYSLRSIDQFAPWIRKIWIVTAGQTPSWLDTNNPRIEIVSHEDIWPDLNGLPNFNSHAIESNLHRIEGLSEHYLYFNDDFFLTRPVDPTEFFYGNGISKIFHSKAMVDFDEVSELDNASSVAAKNARKALESKGYPIFSRKFFHTPSPLNRKIIERAEKEFPEIFELTRSAQFRDTTDVAISGSFFFNYALACGAAVPSQIKYDYIDPATRDGRERMKRLINKRDKDCIVINDGSTPESVEERVKTDQFIRSSLAALLPSKSQFELESLNGL